MPAPMLPALYEDIRLLGEPRDALRSGASAARIEQHEARTAAIVSEDVSADVTANPFAHVL